MKPWNPYATTFHGQPITGQTPPKLVVYGPPLTAQQGAMLQTAYNAFIGAARVSIVPNPTRQGRLLDGSPYTIECSGASCTCTVWPVGAGGDDRNNDIANGLLRLIDGRTVDGKLLLHEFRENGKPYIDTYAFTAKVKGVEELSQLMWNAFSPLNLSGPAAILCQFGRGASKAYTQALGTRADATHSRSVGLGVVVLPITTGGITKKAVFFYRMQDERLVAVRGEVLGQSALKAKIPDEIMGIFGGAPLPPSEQQWSLATTVLNTTMFSSAAGSDHNVSGFGGQGRFPVVASTGDGTEAHFVWQDFEHVPHGTLYYAAVLKISFFAESGFLGGTVSTVVGRGIYNALITKAGIPDPGVVWSGPLYVTHVAGALTIFTRKHEFDRYDRGNGTGYEKFTQKITESWGSGSDKSVITYQVDEYESFSASQTGTRTLAKDGERTDVFVDEDMGLPPGTGYRFTFKYERYRFTEQGSGSIAYKKKKLEGLGDIRTYNREGVFQVFRGERSEHTASASANISSSYLYTEGGNEWRRVHTILEYPSFTEDSGYHPLDTAAFFVDYSDTAAPATAENLFKYIGAYEWGRSYIGGIPLGHVNVHTPDMTRTPTERAAAILGFIALHEGSTGSYTYDVSPTEGKVVSTNMHMYGITESIPAMAILEKFEDAERIEAIKKSHRFGFDNPISFINQVYVPGEERGIREYFSLSQLGGHQALYTIASTATKGYRYSERYDMSWGSLVDNQYDREYPSLSAVALQTFFVGVLQP